MKKLSILGCGWLGTPLARAFLQQGYEVLGSSTRQEKLIELKRKGIRPFLIELPQQISMLESFLDTEWLIINFPPPRRPDVQAFHLKQFEVLKPMLNQLSKIVLISSTSVYPNLNRSVQESDAQNPAKESGKALLQVEQWLQKSFPNTTVLRFGGLIATDRMASMFKRAKSKTRLGAALTPLNLIHQTDCINIILKIVKNDVTGQVFNACAPSHPTRQEFYNAIATANGQALPKFERQQATNHKLVDSSQIEQTLNYQFTYPDLIQLARQNFGQ